MAFAVLRNSAALKVATPFAAPFTVITRGHDAALLPRSYQDEPPRRGSRTTMRRSATRYTRPVVFSDATAESPPRADIATKPSDVYLREKAASHELLLFFA